MDKVKIQIDAQELQRKIAVGEEMGKVLTYPAEVAAHEQKMAELHEQSQMLISSYQSTFNYVGAKLCEAGEQPRDVLKTEEQARIMFGEKIAQAKLGEYIAEDSIYLRLPLTYTLVSEGEDTFVLRIKKGSLLNLLPGPVQEEMTRRCLNREEEFRSLVLSHLKALHPEQIRQDRLKQSLKTHIKSNFPNITRQAQNQMIIQSKQ